MARLGSGLAFTVTAGTTASSTGRTSGTVLDMTGYEGVLFIGFVDATSSANGLYAQYGNTTLVAEIATGKVQASATCMVLDLHRPNGRYVNGVITASGVTAKRGPIIAIQYGARNKPTTNTSTVAIGYSATPASGGP